MKLLPVIIALFLPLVSGCATTAFLIHGREAMLNDPVTPLSPVYSRTDYDATMMGFPFWAFFGDYDHSGDNAYATTYACIFGPFMIVGGLVDLPVSLIIDTFTFPQDHRRSRQQNNEQQPQSVAVYVALRAPCLNRDVRLDICI